MKNDKHLLFIPGTLCTEALFAPQITFFKARGYHCQVAKLDGGNTMEAMARNILLKAPEQFSLIGLSMGGILAFELIRQAPERILRLALLDTNSRAETPEKMTGRLTAIDAIDDLEIQGLDGLLPFVEYTLFPKYTAVPSDDLARLEAIKSTVLQMAESTGWQIGKAQMQALNTRADSTSLLRDIKIPTAIICGAQDQLCPIDRHTIMHEQMPFASLDILPNCGHLSTLEQSDKVNSILQEWLQRDCQYECSDTLQTSVE